MEFTIFKNDAHMDSRIELEGFSVFTSQQILTFSSDSTHTHTQYPLEYSKKDGSLWRQLLLPSAYADCFCLVKQPSPSFSRLSEIFFNTADENEETACLAALAPFMKSLLDEFQHGTITFPKSKRVRHDKLVKLRAFLCCIDSHYGYELDKVLITLDPALTKLLKNSR